MSTSASPRRRSFLVALLLAASSACTVQSQQPADPVAVLQTGTLNIWASGRANYLNWDTIHRALSNEYPGLQVNFRLVQPQQLITLLATFPDQEALPDVLFVDNWGQGGDLIEQQSVTEMIGRPRFPTRGWWFLMHDGVHQAEAKAFLHWLQDDPHWTAPTFAATGMTSTDRDQSTASAISAVSSLARGDDASSVFDPDAIRPDTSHWGTYCGSIIQMAHPAVRFLGGNGSLAYTAITSDARSEGGKVACAGLMHSFVVLRKQDQAWKVLLLMPEVSLPQAVSFADNFQRLNLAPSPAAAPAIPILLAPYDGAPQTRFPKQEISWQQPLERPAAYIVESRAGVPKNGDVDYGPSMIYLVDPKLYGDIVRIPMPFGVGKQPHRWRICAIGQDGQVALSEWRTVDFTN